MKIIAFIKEELERLATIEFEHGANPAEKKELFRLMDAFSQDEVDIEDDVLKPMKKHTLIRRSDRMRFIVDQLLIDPSKNCSLKTLEAVRHRMEQEPNNHIYPLVWTAHQAHLFEEEEYFEIEIVHFLEKVLSEYPYLVHLDDFLEMTGIDLLLLDSEWVERNARHLLPCLQAAMNQYPKKIRLHALLGKVLFLTGDYRQSRELLTATRNRVISEYQQLSDIAYDDFDWWHYLNLVNDLAKVCDKLEAYDEVRFYLDYLISVIPEGTYMDANGNDIVEEDTISYLDSYMLRMRANMIGGKDDEFAKDLAAIEAILTDKDDRYSGLYSDFVGSLKEEFADVMLHIERLGKPPVG